MRKALGKFTNLFMPCPFTGPKMFCVGPKFLSQSKNLFTYFANLFTYIFCQLQTFCAKQKIDFCAGKKVFKEAQNAVEFLGWLKKIWSDTKHFGTCKRTRHQLTYQKYVAIKMFVSLT